MKVYYDGIGSNGKNEHTIEEFLDIMRVNFTEKVWDDVLRRHVMFQHQLQFKQWVLPRDFIKFTLDDWIEYSGAVLVKI
jgi:hypothetical protein